MIKPAMLSLDYNLKFMFASIDADNIAKLKIILRCLLSTYTIPSSFSVYRVSIRVVEEWKGRPIINENYIYSFDETCSGEYFY